MVIALITAAGVGTRMGLDVPKQFIHIEDKPLIIYTLEAFQNHPVIDRIVVVTLPNWKDVVRAYANQFGITKLSDIVNGGSTGQESIRKGIEAISEMDSVTDEDIVIIHDGNRCLVSAAIISDSVAKFYEHGNSVTVIPTVEAVFLSEDGKSSTRSIDRNLLWRTQTPHTYTLGKLKWAHEKANEEGITNSIATCTLMEELGEAIHFSAGSEENIKITTMDDLSIFKAILNSRRKEG